jgi:hypothetical protein
MRKKKQNNNKRRVDAYDDKQDDWTGECGECAFRNQTGYFMENSSEIRESLRLPRISYYSPPILCKIQRKYTVSKLFSILPFFRFHIFRFLLLPRLFTGHLSVQDGAARRF